MVNKELELSFITSREDVPTEGGQRHFVSNFQQENFKLKEIAARSLSVSSVLYFVFQRERQPFSIFMKQNRSIFCIRELLSFSFSFTASNSSKIFKQG